MANISGWYIITAIIFMSAIYGCTDSCPECVCEECVDCPECDLNPIEAVCQPCPPAITNYVCQDGSIESTPEGCTRTDGKSFIPILTNEEGTLITTATVTPACVYGEHGGSVYFKLETIADLVEFQIKESPDEEFRTIHNMTNAYEGRRSFSIVKPGSIWSHGDFDLLEGSKYLFRLKFSLPAYNSVQYSNEHLIDLDGQDYRIKQC